MLSRQIYTPKYCENILSFDGKPSPDNPRTPTFVPHFGVLAKTLFVRTPTHFRNLPTQVVSPCSGNSSNAYLCESGVLHKNVLHLHKTFLFFIFYSFLFLE